MSTKIEWTDETWNPVVGCDPVSSGCDHCYAATLAAGRLKHLPLYAGLTTSGQFNGVVKVVPDRVNDPLSWRQPRRVFVNSMSDLFHDEIAEPWLADIFAVMAAARRHTFQVLTKRHGRMRSLLNRAGFVTQVKSRATGKGLPADQWVWPLPNVWLGVSAEDQASANLRIPALLETPAEIRFVSAEPLLGPVDLTRLQRRPDTDAMIDALSGDVWNRSTGEIYAAAPGCIDWVIVGGESGRNARPMYPGWARSLRDQTAKAGRAFLFKQWGEWVPAGLGIGRFVPPEILVGEPLDDMGHRQIMRRVGKKNAGRELDGRTWDEFPQEARS